VFLTIDAAGDELSYLLFKHPGRLQRFELPMGQASVWYPVADADHCQVALLVDVDERELAKSKLRFDRFDLGSYINDRAYAASSLLAVAIARVFGSALRGQDPAERPGAAAVQRELRIRVPSVHARGELSVQELFEPLGYQVDAVEHGEIVDLTLSGTLTVQQALAQLYVLLPVLDDSKHYWVSFAEIDKLERHAESWLPAHPQRERIMARYLAHQREYVAQASARLLADEDQAEHSTGFKPPNLAAQRTAALLRVLHEVNAQRVIDLGCGEGRLVTALLGDSFFTEVAGADVSASVLARAERHLERLSERQLARVKLFQASATYRDSRLAGFDAMVLSEVVEHLDPDRLAALESTVFAAAHPHNVIVTTPNREYNVRYAELGEGGLRHPDHRFEWTRAEFQTWANEIAERQGYRVRFDGVGEADADLGAPTQMAIFTSRGRDD
jgi:3' terminal RNA ribose 2'-O-methyltransferase Hen1